MRELDTYTPSEITDRTQTTLLICDEGSIKCTTFRDIQKRIFDNGRDVILAMPDQQYRKGLRGWAKAQVLASVSENILGVMPLDHESAKVEKDRNWAEVQVNGPVVWNERKALVERNRKIIQLPITESFDPFDKQMIELANKTIEASNCWLDPAGCVFVRDREILLTSVSTSFNNSNCTSIPISYQELQLEKGERWRFCDSLHAERVGVSNAAREGISLEGATMYINKFPCRSCSQQIISAGIKSVVFEVGSYGLADADLLVENEIFLKRVVD